ncbi:hypothetical protein SE18_11550 [Herpetosiphon geysericola]|uniref:Uncharacterized protein n=1 Tax=Herpetosiphon geysericola TaxID=70996 RepID=A0A0P6YT38_9CHLR|nr:hypothetical protein SE18_11550 [Herpetosiphon geysericola]
MLLSNLLTLVKNRLNPFVTGRNRHSTHEPSHIFIPNVNHFATFVAIVTKVPQQSARGWGLGIRDRVLGVGTAKSAMF